VPNAAPSPLFSNLNKVASSSLVSTPEESQGIEKRIVPFPKHQLLTPPLRPQKRPVNFSPIPSSLSQTPNELVSPLRRKSARLSKSISEASPQGNSTPSDDLMLTPTSNSRLQSKKQNTPRTHGMNLRPIRQMSRR